MLVVGRSTFTTIQNQTPESYLTRFCESIAGVPEWPDIYCKRAGTSVMSGRVGRNPTATKLLVLKFVP